MEDYGVAVVVHPSQHSIVVMAFPANLCNAFFFAPSETPAPKQPQPFDLKILIFPGLNQL